MNIEIDTHTHTISSGHAFSTVNEMVAAAAEKGLKYIAITDHAPGMPGGPHIYHFHTSKFIPDTMFGVRVLKGIEANFVNYKGEVDVTNETLEILDIVIASFHAPCIASGPVERITGGMIKAMENPNINIIGHPDDDRYPIDIPAVVAASKATGTYLEMNNSSLLPTSFRAGARKRYIKILEECGNHDVPIIMGSDAHHTSTVGRFDMTTGLINEVGFPKELVLNYNAEKFLKSLGK